MPQKRALTVKERRISAVLGQQRDCLHVTLTNGPLDRWGHQVASKSIHHSPVLYEIPERG